jgi:hypothetical protein
LSDESWTAWQWNRPEARDGLVIALRRPKSSEKAVELHLRHIDSDASYDVEFRTTFNKGGNRRMSGKDLAHLAIQIPDAPGSMLVFYKRR